MPIETGKSRLNRGHQLTGAFLWFAHQPHRRRLQIAQITRIVRQETKMAEALHEMRTAICDFAPGSGHEKKVTRASLNRLDRFVVICLLRRVKPDHEIKAGAAAVLGKGGRYFRRRKATSCSQADFLELPCQLFAPRTDNEQRTASEFLRDEAREIRTKRMGGQMQHRDIILIEARRRQI